MNNMHPIFLLNVDSDILTKLLAHKDVMNNGHPIFLLNMDYEILAKVLANRIEAVTE